MVRMRPGTLFLLLSLMHSLQDGRRSSSDFESAVWAGSEASALVVVVEDWGEHTQICLISCQLHFFQFLFSIYSFLLFLFVFSFLRKKEKE